MSSRRRRAHRSLRALFAAWLVCTLVACGTGGHVSASVGPRHPVAVGVNTDITSVISNREIRTEVGLIRRAGVRWIRATVDLSGAEYQRAGKLNEPYLKGIDAAIRIARAAKLNVLLGFDRTPYWASADPRKYRDRSGGLHWNHYWAYKRPQDFARIAAALVRRYEPMGVHAYEIWSEPNWPDFWPSGVNAVAYTQLIKLAHHAIKRVDRRAVVVMGGLSNFGVYQYLQAMYRAGARGLYDVANFHLYPNGDPAQCELGADHRPRVHSLCLLSGIRSEMLANRDRAPAWVTELGWSTCSYPPCVTPGQQARYLTGAVRLLEEHPYAWIKKAFVYQMRDVAGPYWRDRLGLVSQGFAPKPAYHALTSLTAVTGLKARGSAAGKKQPRG